MRMRLPLAWTLLLAAAAVTLLIGRPTDVESACCYFAAKDKDILQPAQKAFLTWDPQENVETFTVQPRFEGNAPDFGMVIPTPSQPKLHEMPREFFKELAIFTILEPMDITKYKKLMPIRALGAGGGGRGGMAPAARKSQVKILEKGIVGSLDYKIIQAEQADDLFTWLKDNHYNYAGDQETLDFYIKQKWFFTVMKIDPMQMKKRPDGSYDGDVTPTRFNFASDKLIYPLKITQISVRNKTEALFYVQAPHKMDLTGDFSYEVTWQPMWSQATTFALPEKLTAEEVSWQQFIRPRMQDYNQQFLQMKVNRQIEPTTLEWARKITDKDLAVLEGSTRYNRDAPPEDVAKLKLLRGHIQKGQFVTKLRKIFTKAEMDKDLEFVRARVGDRDDNMEYVAILPTSPP